MKYPKRNRRYDDVLEEIYDIHDSLTEEEYYDSLYYVLGNTYPDASEEELEEIFEEMLENMSEQQAEDFMSSLGSIGKKIGSGLAQVPNFLGKNPELLSTIGGIAGNLILPGAGGMIGGALGSAAGGLLQNKNAQNNLQQQQQNPNAIVNSDAAKLNSLMQDPQMQRALMQMSTTNVPIAPLTSNGQTTHVPIANFLHALIRQAQAALQQLDALIPPQVQEALAENFGEDFAGEDLGEALLEEVRVNGGFEGGNPVSNDRSTNIPEYSLLPRPPKTYEMGYVYLEGDSSEVSKILNLLKMIVRTDFRDSIKVDANNRLDYQSIMAAYLTMPTEDDMANTSFRQLKSVMYSLQEEKRTLILALASDLPTSTVDSFQVGKRIKRAKEPSILTYAGIEKGSSRIVYDEVWTKSLAGAKATTPSKHIQVTLCSKDSTLTLTEQLAYSLLVHLHSIIVYKKLERKDSSDSIVHLLHKSWSTWKGIGESTIYVHYKKDDVEQTPYNCSTQGYETSIENDFLKDTLLALKTLKDNKAMVLDMTEEGKETIDMLSLLKQNVITNVHIHSTRGNQNETKDFLEQDEQRCIKIKWNNEKGLCFSNNASKTVYLSYGQEEDINKLPEYIGKASPATLLGHELVHGYGRIFDRDAHDTRDATLKDVTIYPHETNEEEAFAMKMERQIASKMGEKARIPYSSGKEYTGIVALAAYNVISFCHYKSINQKEMKSTQIFRIILLSLCVCVSCQKRGLEVFYMRQGTGHEGDMLVSECDIFDKTLLPEDIEDIKQNLGHFTVRNPAKVKYYKKYFDELKDTIRLEHEILMWNHYTYVFIFRSKHRTDTIYADKRLELFKWKHKLTNGEYKPHYYHKDSSYIDGLCPIYDDTYSACFYIDTTQRKILKHFGKYPYQHLFLSQ